MNAFLSFLVRGRAQAIAICAICAILPFVSFLSGAIVGLVTLRHGARDGAMVAAGAAALVGAVTLLSAGSAATIVLFLAVSWGLVLLLAEVLRSTRSQGMTLTVAGLLGALAVLAVHLFLPDQARSWRELFDRHFLGPLQESDVLTNPAAIENIGAVFDMLAPVMTGLMVAGILLGLIPTVLLARWWHAQLDNPGGFSQEFRELRLGRTVAKVVIVVALVALFARGTVGHIGFELLWIGVALYLFQGLAVGHALVAKFGASAGWLVALYALLFLMPQLAIVLLATIGFTDEWVDVRRRYGSA